MHLPLVLSFYKNLKFLNKVPTFISRLISVLIDSSYAISASTVASNVVLTSLSLFSIYVFRFYIYNSNSALIPLSVVASQHISLPSRSRQIYKFSAFFGESKQRPTFISQRGLCLQVVLDAYVFKWTDPPPSPTLISIVAFASTLELVLELVLMLLLLLLFESVFVDVVEETLVEVLPFILTVELPVSTLAVVLVVTYASVFVSI